MSTDQKTINAYDGYAKKWSQYQGDKNFSRNFLERPAMHSKFPDFKDKNVLCIGSATGEECDYIKSLGAKRVVGIDISEGLINEAKQKFPDLEFYVMDMEKLDFEENSFDYVFSSLTIHYVQDYKPTLKSLYKILKPQGRFLFSTTHPILKCAQVTDDGITKTRIIGYIKHKDTGEYEAIGNYLQDSKLENMVLDEDLIVTQYHKSISSITADIKDSGFVITDILEPAAGKDFLDVDEKHAKIFEKIPQFLIMEIMKI